MKSAERSIGSGLRLAVLALALVSAGRAGEPLQFNRDIRPLLSDRCFKCHGPDKGSRKAGLRLDLPAEAHAKRKDSEGVPIAPGKPEKSLVYQRIVTKDADEVMPPPESHLALTGEEKERIRRWIAEGGKYEPHWAFIPPPPKVALPRVKQKEWPRNEIDRFVLARLEKEGIKPSKEADKARWLRRVTYDLTGLPPAPDEVAALLADTSSEAHAKVVDRLLASKSFGERMAVPWLDAARYADSYGYQSDQLSPTWPFRDWTVNAFNENLPFDQFITEQVAGDLLPTPTRAQRQATAFNRLHRQTNEGGSIAEEWRLEYVADRVHTFGTAFLALTFECSRCHDHKYDPILQRDYYSLSAYFNSIDEAGLYNDSARVPTPSLLLPTPEQELAMRATELLLAEKNAALAKAETEALAGFDTWLKNAGTNAAIPGLAAHFNLETLATNNQFTDMVTTNLSSPLHANTRVPGLAGQGIQFTGDDEVTFPNAAGSLQPWESYSAVFGLWLPAALTNAVVFHRTEGTDVGFHGTELSIENGRLFFVIKRFWPGNAIAVRSMDPVPAGQWTQIAITYDGSARAEGMRLFVNGEPARMEMVRNRLTKSPQNGGNGLSFGARFRSFGLKEGRLDEVRVYQRALAPVEVRHLHDGRSLVEALAQRSEKSLRPYFLASGTGGLEQARRERSAALKSYFETRNPVQETSVMEEMEQPRAAHVLARGAYDAPKNDQTRVPRSTPASLPQFPNGAPNDRLGLARWLTDPNHPLTSRVAVNRCWQLLFGRGLVATTENFGVQGSPPTHPELLDWLARDFVNSGWNTKRMLRQIVLSATYRQDSAQRADLREKDPENFLLARGPSHRLTAEMIRDTALAASGLLSAEMGGPPVSPYMPGDLWRESNSMSPGYHQSVGPGLYRRSLYTVAKRTAPMPNMAAFDSPSREVCTVKRSNTGTPQQAFVLLNDPQFVEAARVLAEQTLQTGGATVAERTAFAFQKLTGRQPNAKEMPLLEELWQEQRKIFAGEPDRAKQLIETGERKRDAKLDPVELAATTALCQAILNLDATVWKR